MKNNKKRAKIREFDRLEREDDDLDLDIGEIEDVDMILSGHFSDEDDDDEEGTYDGYGSLIDDDDDDDDYDMFIEGLND